jgi:hypothetical protein
MTGGVRDPWACAVPADPNTSGAPKISTAPLSATGFRMVSANVVTGLRHVAAGWGSRSSDRIDVTNRVV